MNIYIANGIIFIILLALELCYFKVAGKFNIIDKPNERSSHSSIVLRGGGVVFSLAIVVWAIMMIIQGESGVVLEYLPFLIGLLLVAGVSFWDDIKSLPDSVRLLVQFGAMVLMFWSMGIMHWNMWWIVLIALVISVGATNIINFMDGINGITAGYALAVLIPLVLLNNVLGFVYSSFLMVAILGVLIFCIFNFRPKGKAKCFAGDVGSIGIAFILLFLIGRLIISTGDVTYLLFLLVYGVDGCLTIIHRIMLHENLGVAHRKHAYQLMANELKIGHVKVSLMYMGMQLVVSLGFIYLTPMLAALTSLSLVIWHWIYLVCVLVMLSVAYVLFMKKYYHLHEEYLASLMKRD